MRSLSNLRYLGILGWSLSPHQQWKISSYPPPEKWALAHFTLLNQLYYLLNLAVTQQQMFFCLFLWLSHSLFIFLTLPYTSSWCVPLLLFPTLSLWLLYKRPRCRGVVLVPSFDWTEVVSGYQNDRQQLPHLKSRHKRVIIQEAVSNCVFFPHILLLRLTNLQRSSLGKLFTRFLFCSTENQKD